MLSNGFEVPLHLQLNKSKQYLGFQLCVHILAVIAISLPSSIPVIIRALIVLVIVIHALIRIHSYHQRFIQPPFWVWQKSGVWIEISEHGDVIWSCDTNHLITPWFVIVDLHIHQKKCSLVIFKDQCDADSFRRLRVRLKYYQEPVASPTDAG